MLVDDPRYVSNFAVLRQPNDDGVSLVAYDRDWIEAEANRSDESALRDSCIALANDGVAKFASSLQAARVVGLGESTHGTREYTELRSRVVEELARDGWLTTIALEGSWQEVAHIDDYVRGGKGTARDAVAALTSWPWRTEEFVAFVETVRKLNDGLPADKKIEFVGIDYEAPSESAKFLDRYFDDGKATHAAELSELVPLRRAASWGELSKVSSEDRRRVSSALAKLSQAEAVGEPNGLVAALALQITQRLVETPDEDARDRVMAGAVIGLLDRSDRVRHIAIWAHNGHLAEGPIEGSIPMGRYLKERLHDEYRAIGSIFYDGSFFTYSRQDKPVSHVVAVPPPSYFESAMHRASPSSACILDIAAASKRTSIRDWISVPKYVRLYGGVEISESYPFAPVVIPDLWSAVLFVPTSTPTTPL
jgi:erythromycin esterase